MTDLLLVRRLQPWANNVGKRLVRSPKVYVRDSGLVHALLGLSTLDSILGHPVAGASWEGMVIENITAALPSTASPWFYRTSAGAELDLLIDFDGGDRWAIEVKRSLAPSLSKGFHIACADVNAARGYLVYPGSESYPIGDNTSTTSLQDLLQRIRERK